MTSPYLDQPLLPLAVVLPRMLEKIETELANETASASDNWHLRQRAQLIRGLLASGSGHPTRRDRERGRRLDSGIDGPVRWRRLEFRAPCDKDGFGSAPER